MTLADVIPTLRSSLAARLEPGCWPSSTTTNCAGEVTVGGVDLAELAARFGTPVTALDVADVRLRCREYRRLLPGVEVAYAGKAFLTRAMARLVTQEGLSLDVCSAGEIAVAAAAGVSGEKMLLHGNVKTDDDLKAAFAAGVGRIVIDSLDEIDVVATLAPARQRVLLRVVPGVDADTHRALTTGTEDQKFGLSLRTGAAAEAVAAVLARPELELVGLHCHLGSQVRDVARYATAARRLVGFLAEIARTHGVMLGQLDLGGGFAVAASPHEHDFDLARFAHDVPAVVSAAAGAAGLAVPRLIVEPGRSLVARAGVTVYRVAAVKRGATRTFVAVDGGMSDNPRPALYGASYLVRRLGPTRAPSRPVTVVGRHCEAGDVLATDVALPADVAAGDLLAVPGCGAYHASLASSYNHVGRSPVVAVASGAALPMLRRETVDDLLRRDVG